MANAVRDVLEANLTRADARVTSACARAGRPRSNVTLVAVTKSVSIEVAAELAALGVRDFGENRPQELWRKAESLPGVRWHLIGHLQRNKIDRTLPLVHRVHSVDSLRLLQALDAAGSAEAMLEFNCSGEASKGGFSPSEIDVVADTLSRLRQVRVVGLMTMAAFEDDPEGCRPTFRALRQLRDQLSQRHRMPELSMGMSNDFEVAIEEGATHIRLGTILFEGLPS